MWGVCSEEAIQVSIPATHIHQIIRTQFTKIYIYITFSEIFNSCIRPENTKVFRQAEKWGATETLEEAPMFVSVTAACRITPANHLFTAPFCNNGLESLSQKSTPTWHGGCQWKICFGIKIPSTHLEQGLLFAEHIFQMGLVLFLSEGQLITCLIHFCGLFIMGKFGCLTHLEMLRHQSRDIYGLYTVRWWRGWICIQTSLRLHKTKDLKTGLSEKIWVLRALHIHTPCQKYY